ncbi:conserved hypothetical protein [Hyphomicrobiales bacterium]|nr:conserved hypothetical protein [Hyphomicrobiales bacterium]CAH1665190.1 conserved hypothetical protein [Hyphomicrobiales bacterium]
MHGLDSIGGRAIMVAQPDKPSQALSAQDLSAQALRRPRSGTATIAALILSGLTLAGCAIMPEERQSMSQSATTGLAITRDQLVGRWGIASFHDEKDRKRTEAQARSQCGQPYVITKGPTNGVMMHVADDAQLYELALKRGPDGKTYIGFEAPAGHPQDREVLSYNGELLVMRFVDPDANRRYGTFIFARCGN